MTRKRRTIEDLKRHEPFRPPNKAELIVCEGSSTEPEYFNELKRKLRLSSVQIDVIASRGESEPINIVERAISKKREGARQGVPYSNIWCVIDVEVPPRHESLEKAMVKPKDNKVEIILSNPFFEYWLLLHFEKILTPFNEDKYLHTALKAVHPTYKKTRIGFDILYPHTKTAIKNSKEVLKETGCGDDLRNYNPSTHVHRLVEHLQNIATRETIKI